MSTREQIFSALHSSNRTWLARNGREATKDDILDVCNVLRSAISGGEYRYSKAAKVHELRVEMRRLLLLSFDAISRDRARYIAEIEAEKPNPKPWWPTPPKEGS